MKREEGMGMVGGGYEGEKGGDIRNREDREIEGRVEEIQGIEGIEEIQGKEKIER